MSRDRAAPIVKTSGPSGFIELPGQMLVVDYGKIYHEGEPIGFLFEDGLLKFDSPAIESFEGLQPIESVKGAKFRGIDESGLPLELPGESVGPSGTLVYNNVHLAAINGRLATADHKLVGEIDDAGNVHLRDREKKELRRKLDENSQLSTIGHGLDSKGQKWQVEITRPLYRKDKSYFENEVIRYFEDFDKLSAPQKKYVKETMRFWAVSGLLQIVRKSEGTAALGNVKHGTAGVTGVRTGFVTLDREEFEKEVKLYKQYGCFWIVARPQLEVRLNLVVSHEYGHQLEFVLSQAAQERIQSLFEKRLRTCVKLHPLPKGVSTDSELVVPEGIDKRCFVSGYAKSSHHEYFAEAVAAFSVISGRQELLKIDPEMHAMLCELITNPENLVRPVFVEIALALQASLRVGGELEPEILNC
ncbi:MAG: hypothetical protein K2X29_05270 [Candidatus Obscuribacterales bacterium]|nr:hypothetical protein [Candidatus Obscuribacterales bacterium]